ncbi:hypothetical protein M3Y97_00080400 [Aphelenchoides bicaudatus]|nr:hypothetical protein M3Y97_00080400 [Aphelenchoides bicaudatus]
MNIVFPHDHLERWKQKNRSSDKRIRHSGTFSDDNQASKLKIQEQEKQIAELKAKLESNQLRFAEEKRALITEHKNELKKKETELVEKEINVIQRLSLSTPLSENKYGLNESLSNKTPLSEINSLNASFNRPGSTFRPQSLYINSTPNARLSAHDLVGKDRHRNAFANSSNQLYVSRSSSTTPDSGAIIPMGLSPHLIPLFRELVTNVFHLHNSSDEASKFTNDWLNNIRPQICSPHLRIAFADLLTKLDQMQNEDIEQTLEHTNKLLTDCINTVFGLRRDLVELRKTADQRCKDSTVERIDETEDQLDLP